tara:strand:+ start:148 stop:366 length:219 start_codon:yes stop_codon:yes gene_type:complete
MSKNKQGYEKVLSEKIENLTNQVNGLSSNEKTIVSTLKSHGDALIDMSKSIERVAKSVQELLEVVNIIYKSK